MSNEHLSKELASFAANLKASDIPSDVMSRAEDLLVDWFGSAIAGKGSRPVEAITQFAENMGGFDKTHAGPSEILITRKNSSPFLAAMANAAASHVAEQDDVHNGSVFHPATVVFPPVLACAQAISASGEEFLVAAVAGYEVGIRVGDS
jgi:2-methylcitrate dehydratase PrpD